ncbi:MAG: tetratricopeptide repeat protein [Limisphaerales bacterium]
MKTATPEQGMHVRESSPAAKSVAFFEEMGWKTSFLGALLLICLTLLAYGPAINSGFIWDDDVMLTENAAIKSNQGLRTIWFSTELSDYFPLTSTMFWLEWRLWGLNPTGYNVVNILLHAFSSILLWRLLVQLKIPGAFIAGLIFALHPVCVASVAWIAERKNTLSLLFYLLTLMAYLKFDEKAQRRFFWLAFACFLLALLAKTSVVMLPCVLLLIAWWKRNSIQREDVIRALPFFAASLVFGLITVWFQSGRGPIWAKEEADDLLTRVLGGTWATWFYLFKAIIPLNLTMVYPKWTIESSSILSYLPGMIWLGLGGLLWKMREQWGRPILFGLGFFLINLFPVFGVFEMSFLIHSRVADHWQYIALMGVVALVSAGLVRTLKAWNAPQVATVPVIGILLFGLTRNQATVYQDEETLWRDTMEKNPDAWVAYTKLGDQLAQQRQFEEAADLYLRAIEIFPHHPNTHNNRGNVLSFQGRTNEALQHYFQALRLNPEYADAHNNLGVHLLQLGDAPRALSHFEEAISIRPGYGAAHFNAGNASFKMAEYERAEFYYGETVRLKPHIPEAHYNLAISLIVQGKREPAIEHLKEALRLRPDYQEAHYELQELKARKPKR